MWTVGSACVCKSRCAAVRGNAPAPATEITPPGVITLPNKVTVPPLKEILAPASVEITAPLPMTMSPRTSSFSKVNGSSEPRAVKLRLTGERTPFASTIRCNEKAPPPSMSWTAIKPVARGVIWVPAMIKIAGS